MNRHIDKAIAFVARHIDADKVRSAMYYMELHRTPLSVEDPMLYDTIYDLMEEYSDDNELSEGWWLYEGDVDDVLYQINEYKS